MWETKLEELTNKRFSLRDTARQLQVDPATVKKYAKKLGLKTYWTKRGQEEKKRTNTIEQCSVINNKEKNRRDWLNLRKQYPIKSKTELRQVNNRVFTWLYRNDRDWLNQNSPRLKSTIHDSHRVNWGDRDEGILEIVKVAITEILSIDGKPKRITVSSIGSMLGIRPLLEKHLDKLPKTKEYMVEHTEGIRDFQVRRLQWAVQELREEGQDLSLWRIYRKAGIRENFQKELQEEAIKLVAKENDLYPCVDK